MAQRRVGRRPAGVALALVALAATSCSEVRVPTPDGEQLVGAVSTSGGRILGPGERAVEDGEVLLVPLDHRETLLADTLADQHDWNDQQLSGTGAWQIPLDQVEAAGGRLEPVGDHGQFVFDEVEPGPAFVCVGGERSPADGFRARGCLEIDVRPPMAITLVSVEGQLQLEVDESA